MIITARKILDMNRKYNFIQNLSEREMNPEGIGFDIRVKEVYKLCDDGFLGVNDRKSPKLEKVADIDNNDESITLSPGEYVLIKTIEKVNIPSEKIFIEELNQSLYIMLDVYPRSTLQRCGVYFKGTKTDPGYYGELTFGLKNESNVNFKLELGARIANIVFKTAIGEISRPYEGQWKGGRVGTEGLEKQK